MRRLKVTSECPFVVQVLLVERVGAYALDEAFKPLLRLCLDLIQCTLKLRRFHALDLQLVAGKAQVNAELLILLHHLVVDGNNSEIIAL